jgi:hypothetical protein
MYERIKSLLSHCINIVAAVVLLGACLSYVAIMTHVINSWRLDTYVTLDTGLGIVLLVLLLGWGPVWIARAFKQQR